MYLKSIAIQHLKRLADFRLDIPDVAPGEPRRWTVLIGENGTAKTSILQAIAMAAAGGSQVNAVAERGVDLLRDRRGDAPMSVTADFCFTPESRRRLDNHPLWNRDGAPTGLRSTLQLDAGSTTVLGEARYTDEHGEVVDGRDPLNHARAVHTPLWFVACYGVARTLPDSSLTPDLTKRSIERLKPMFDQRVQLASVGFANHFLKRDAELGLKSGTMSRRFGRVLNAIIKLGGEDLLPGIVKLELRGSGGTRSASDLIDSDRFELRMGRMPTKIAGVALSHGFQSTFAWIADLVGHILLEADAELDTTEMEGLVLIDEIDLYLHPKWQTSFIQGLRRVFPRMQFIATTHSPVVLAGLEAEEIVRLRADPASGDVVHVARDPVTGDLVPVEALHGPAADADPRAMTGTEVYEDYFGIDRLTLHPHGAELRAYVALAGDPLRNDKQEAEVRRLRRALERAGMRDLPVPVARRHAG